MPTLADVNELTTSGAFPPRRAAMILSSLIPPTTLTVTAGLLLSYSAATFLNSLSSRALQPTQTVSVVAAVPPFAAGEVDAASSDTAAAATATSASAASRTTIVAMRFI